MTQSTTRPTPDISIEIGPTEERSFLRWAGWSGLAATLAFVVTIVVTNAGGPASPESSAEILGYLDEVSTSSLGLYAYGIAGIVLCVLYVPMAVGIHRLLGRSTVAWHGSFAVTVGLAVLFPAYLINLLIPAGLSHAASDPAIGAESLYAVFAYAEGAAESLFTVGSALSLAIGPLLWGYGWLKADLDRRWIGWVGLVAGITGFVWFVWLLDTPIVLIVLMVNVVASLAMFTGASAALIADGRGRS